MAQGRGGFGGGMMGGSPVQLLGMPAVQKELKLDEGQIEKAQALATEIREKSMGLRDQLEGLQGQEMMTKRQELMKPINEKAMKDAHAFLKPEQVKRMHELSLQQRGPAALANDEALAKKFNVTEEQKTKIRTINQDMMAEMRDMAPEERQSGMAKLRKETNTKIVALMTEDQKKMWKESTGEPFEFPAQQPRRGNN
jgi:hypothetical protein